MTTQTFEQTRWALEDLLPTTEGPEFDQILADLELAVRELEGSRDQLFPGMPPEQFLRLMTLVETIAALSSRLGSYSYLWDAEDTQAQKALAFRGRIEKLLATRRFDA